MGPAFPGSLGWLWRMQRRDAQEPTLSHGRRERRSRAESTRRRGNSADVRKWQAGIMTWQLGDLNLGLCFSENEADETQFSL